MLLRNKRFSPKNYKADKFIIDIGLKNLIRLLPSPIIEYGKKYWYSNKEECELIDFKFQKNQAEALFVKDQKELIKLISGYNIVSTYKLPDWVI